MAKKKLRIALLGLGTVGRGVYDYITERDDMELAYVLSLVLFDGITCPVAKNMEQILDCAVQTVQENALYTPGAFADGNAARKALDYGMSDLASADRDTVLERMAAGQSAEKAMEEFLTDAYFEAWYQAIRARLEQYEG